MEEHLKGIIVDRRNRRNSLLCFSMYLLGFGRANSIGVSSFDELV
jgi:hypothetical protein